MAGSDDWAIWLFPLLVLFIIIILLIMLKRKPHIRNKREREIQEAVSLIRRFYNAGRPENVIITTLMKLGFNTEEISEILKRARLG